MVTRGEYGYIKKAAEKAARCRIRRGAFTGTAEDRANGWYIDPVAAGILDRRGPGWPTLGVAISAIEQKLIAEGRYIVPPAYADEIGLRALRGPGGWRWEWRPPSANIERCLSQIQRSLVERLRRLGPPQGTWPRLIEARRALTRHLGLGAASA